MKAGVRSDTLRECKNDPSMLLKYFKEHASCPEYIVREASDGFNSINNIESIDSEIKQQHAVNIERVSLEFKSLLLLYRKERDCRTVPRTRRVL